MAALDTGDGRDEEPAPWPELRHVLLFVLLQLAIMAASLIALWPLLSRLFA